MGLFREQGENSFERLHTTGPIAFFDACAAAGVPRLVQLSALGADEGAQSRYHLSKRNADEHLLALSAGAVVVQPSLVFGPGGESSRFFLSLASAPLQLLPEGGGQRLQPVHVAAVVVRHVVIADWLFTSTTVVFQPMSGLYLAHLAHWPITTPWIAWSFALYFLAGACWLPVVWLQLRMRDMAQHAASAGEELPPLYWRCLRVSTALGFPAFFALVVVFYLMVAKPA